MYLYCAIGLPVQEEHNYARGRTATCHRVPALTTRSGVGSNAELLKLMALVGDVPVLSCKLCELRLDVDVFRAFDMIVVVGIQ